jgi:hypothetical protein
MTEYELVESIGVYASNSLQALSLFLTIVSAYLIAAFMAGDKLARRQVIIINTLFIIGALLFTYSTVGLLIRQVYYASQLAKIETDTFLAGRAPIAPIIGLVQLGGIAASLKFMWDIRHPKPD